MKVLILGHPRSGTKFAAYTFRRAGWDVGHEVLGADGIASWMWATRTEFVPWGQPRSGMKDARMIVHLRREPADLIASVAFTEERSEYWRRAIVPIPMRSEDIERAVWSVFNWDRLIRHNAITHTVRLNTLEGFVSEHVGPLGSPLNAEDSRNTRLHAQLYREQIAETKWQMPPTAKLWQELCDTYDALEAP